MLRRRGFNDNQKAWAKNSMPGKALDSFQWMKQFFGCEPGIRSYNTLVNAFAQWNLWEQAGSFFKYFETVASSQICKLIIFWFRLLLKRSILGERSGYWIWYGKRFFFFHPNVQSYGTLINGLFKGGNLVLELFDEMFKRKLTTDVLFHFF